MAWDHLSINRPHLVYIILGGFTSLFMLCSSFIKERLYIGEATVATICGIIFGPVAADLINPLEWGNTDQITLEFSRIVLVVQCFAVGVELPKYYMEKHWRSVIFLLIPVMTFGWLITSLFIWWLIIPLTWLESLCVSACVTATDPVLASSVVGKGKFAKRVPKHLRDLLSAESGCNDGMAFPFIYLSLYLIKYRTHPNEVAFHWIVLTILYECVFGAFYGFMIGYIGRHGIKYAEKHELVDRESFLVFYFVLALFCAGSGSILGVDDLLVGFAAGIGFSNDGWFTQKTEESHVSNVIDLLINLAYFVYLGTIIPWSQFNTPELGTTPWRLVVIAIFVLLFRRIPIMLALKPLIPDIKTWREAMFAGHFGPIGVGAIFIAILARAELETGSTTPLAEYPDRNAPNYMVVALIWPITVWLVVVSILIHGSSIAVFTLGKHINTLTLTMSYTTAHEDGPSWMNRLPRITTTSKSQAKSVTSENGDNDTDLPPGSLPPTGMPREFLRRQKEEDNGKVGKRSSSIIPRRRKKKSQEERAGGPISDSAIFPQRRPVREDTSDTLTPGDGSSQNEKQEYNEKDGENELGEVQRDPEMQEIMHRHSGERDQHKSDAEAHPSKREVYQEGDDFIIENEDGDVIRTERSPSPTKVTSKTDGKTEGKKTGLEGKSDAEKKEEVVDYMNYKKMKKRLGEWRHRDDEENPNNPTLRKRGPALAYQIGNTIIVEDEDGEVVKTYELPTSKAKEGESSNRPAAPRKLSTWAGLATGLTGGLVGGRKESDPEPSKEGSTSHPEGSASAVRAGLARMGTWGWGGKAGDANEKGPHDTEDDDHRIRFTIGGAGRRLTKDDFLREIQGLDPKARAEVVASSDASPALKAIAKQDQREASPLSGGRGSYPPKQKAIAKPHVPDVDETEEETDSEHERVRRKSVQAALQLSRKKDAPLSSSTEVGGGKAAKVSSYDDDEPETAAEKKRRVQALKGVEDADDDEPESSSSGSRGRRSRRKSEDDNEGEYPETAAERRRREAALGLGGQRDGSRDKDELARGSREITAPEPAVRPLRGIRFAESPVRGEGKK